MTKDLGLLASNGAWSLINQIVRVGTLAIVMIALSRHLGPARFGALVFGLALVRIFAVVATCGLDRILVRQFVEQAQHSRTILFGSLRLKLGLGILSYAGAIITTLAIDPHDGLTIAIVAMAGGTLLFQCFDVFDYFFQATNRFGLTFVGRTLPVLLCTGLKFAAIVAGAPLLLFAGLETLEAACIGFALVLVYRATRSNAPSISLSSRFDGRRLLRLGFPLLLASATMMIYMRSDILILGKLAGLQTAGLYSAASQITEACAIFPMAFLPALFPTVVRWRKCGPAFYRQRFERIFSFAFLAGLITAICLTSMAPFLIQLLYGAAYASAANILIIHSWSAIFIYLSITQSGYDITEGLTWIAAWRITAGAALNIILNFALIPYYGAVGSAFATLIAQAGSGFLFNLAHARTRPIFQMQLRAFLLLPLVNAWPPATRSLSDPLANARQRRQAVIRA